MKVNCIIPAKGTSERLKNKNLLEISNKSLVRLACEKLLKSKYIDNVYLDTESDAIISQVEDLRREGLKVLRRPVSLANNSIGANEMMIYGLHSVSECDILLQTFSTSPTLQVSTIDKCLEMFIDRINEFDSFFTVSKVQEYFWKNDEPDNFSIDNLPNSFELDPLMMETHGLYGITTEALLECKRRVGHKPLLIEIAKTESIDIDNHEDFMIAEALINGL